MSKRTEQELNALATLLSGRVFGNKRLYIERPELSHMSCTGCAILIGGKIWKGQLLLPHREPSNSVMCNVCALKHENYEECVALIHGRDSPLAAGCSSTAITWHVFQPPKE